MATRYLKKDEAGFDLQETIPRVPLKSTTTVSVAAGETETITLTVPSNEMWFIKSWDITLGSNCTCNSILIDSNDSYQIVDESDCLSTYGDLLTANSSVSMSVTSADASAQDNTITVWGWKFDGC